MDQTSERRTERPAEGVIQFRAEHQRRVLSAAELGPVFEALSGWRCLLFRLGAIGQDACRYEGVGFGNVSARLMPFTAGRGRRSFLVSGTQTGGRERPSPADFARVTSYDVQKNLVISDGPCLPSSESLTHAMIYDLAPEVRVVIHGHCPELFESRRRLRLPTTAPQVGYGTPEMAFEVARLFRETTLSETGVFAMGGHPDGVVAFGRSVSEAGGRLVSILAAAMSAAVLKP